MTFLWNGDSLLLVIFIALIWRIFQFIEFKGFEISNYFLLFPIWNLQVAFFIPSQVEFFQEEYVLWSTLIIFHEGKRILTELLF